MKEFRKIPTNLRFLCENYNKKGVAGVCLEGGSGSRKTYSIIDLLILTCTYENLRINIIKETYNSFKTTLYYDFAKRLTEFGIQHKFDILKDVQSYDLFGSRITFIGADNPSKFTGRCDILWLNELLDIPKSVFLQAKQRTERFTIADWNPKFTEHWAYDLENRDDFKFLRTTFLDNPYIPEFSKKEILSYEPTPENIAKGTADDYMWKVYGLGQRGSPEGLVFNNVNYVEQFPPDCESVAFGLDFGEVNETAIVKVGIKNIDGIYNLFIQKLFYSPTENVDIIIKAIKDLEINKHIWADNNKPGWISDIRNAGITILPTKKFDGSRNFWIDTIKRFKINAIKDYHLQKEFDNFRYRIVDGIQLSETIKKYDHLLSATGYAVVGDFRQYLR